MTSDEFARNLALAEVNLQAMAARISILRTFFEAYFRRKLEWRQAPGGPDEVYFVSLARLLIGKRNTPGDIEPILDYLCLCLSSDFKLYLTEVHCFDPKEVFFTDKRDLRHIVRDKPRFDRTEKIQGEIADCVGKLMNPLTALEYLSETIGFHIEPNPSAL